VREGRIIVLCGERVETDWWAIQCCVLREGRNRVLGDRVLCVERGRICVVGDTLLSAETGV